MGSGYPQVPTALVSSLHGSHWLLLLLKVWLLSKQECVATLDKHEEKVWTLTTTKQVKITILFFVNYYLFLNLQ